MAKKISKAGIGAFVVCGIILLVLGIIALGGKDILNTNTEYSLYFDKSVNGLRIGSPVLFRGVQLGSVTKISLVPNYKNNKGFLIAVTVRLSPDAFSDHNTDAIPEKLSRHIIRRLVDNGLRARLFINSMLTGAYRVELDMYPNSAPIYHSNNPDVEIPTIMSPLDNLAKQLEAIPLNEITHELRSSLTHLSHLLNSGEAEKTLHNLRITLENTAEITENLKGTLASMGKDLPLVLASFHTTLEKLGTTAQQAEKALQSTDNTARTANTLLVQDSPLMRNLQQALRDFSAASRAMRDLAATLERNPESLLMGKRSEHR